MSRSPLSFAIAIFMLLAFAAPSVAQVLGIHTGETCLYKDAGKGWTDHRLTTGAVVELTGKKKDGWYPVRMRNGEEGWVASWVAWPMPSDTPLPPAFTDEDIPTLLRPLYGRVIADNVSFRSIPYGGLSGKHDTTRTGFIPRGFVVKITDRIGHWFKVQLGPMDYGWVYDEAFEPAQPPANLPAHGTPSAALENLKFEETPSGSAFSAALTRPLPWSVSSNTIPDSLLLNVYGVDCSALSWFWYFHCWKAGGWCDCRTDRNVLEAFIPVSGKLSGYNASYSKNTLELTINNPAKHSAKRIVIDPGHGAPEPYFPGYAEGAVSPQCTEKEAVMEISRALAGELKQKGFEVMLTRDGESVEMMDLYKRVDYADKMNAELFVSVHSNGDLDKEIEGIEVYWHDPQNRRFAETVAAAMSAAAGRDPGIAAFGSFAVIRPTRVPAILVETGYMTNPEEGKLLCADDYRKKIARGIANGIAEYVESVK